MAYEPPPFMPYEPFLLGVGVVFNLLTFWTQNVHGFQVRTPIWQMAPISRIYTPQPSRSQLGPKLQEMFKLSQEASGTKPN